MKNSAPPSSVSGSALTEALVSLLLLAIAMLGAGAALVDSLAAQRAALLQVRAADLAANLAEALRSASDGTQSAAEIQRWQATVLRQLPAAEPLASTRAPPSTSVSGSALPALFDIRLQWRDPRQNAPARLMLPLGIRAATGAP